MNRKALSAWYREFIGNTRFTPVDARFFGDEPVVMFFEEGGGKPWSVQFRGNGHYYFTAKEAVEAFETLKFND